VGPDGAAEQVSGQALSSGAIGGGVSGLAALAALVLLFLLRRKKKVVEPIEETVETNSTTLDENDAYISEYGLSDPVHALDDGEDDEDLPQAGLQQGHSEGSEMEAMSERNPDEFNGAELDPDET
jgi:hypothetical protein